ncbi:MAG: PKD domain-containing protein, partial [Bacteroidota bacterium]
VVFTNNSSNADFYSWDFGDGNTSFDENPWNLYTSEGDYTVTLIAISDQCPDDTLALTDYIHVEEQTGIIETDASASWRIASVWLTNNTLFIKLNTKENASINVYNLLGELIYSVAGITGNDLRENSPPPTPPREGETFHSGQQDQPAKIDLFQLPGGLYFVKVHIGEHVITEKVVKY